MDKLSTQQVQYLQAHSADMLEKAAARIKELEEVVTEFRRKDEAEKIASQMKEKNLSPSWGAAGSDIVDEIMSFPADKIAAVRMAIDMAAPHDPFAQLDSSRDAAPGEGRVKGASAFEQFVMGNIG